jgi:hypothetical protein
MTTDNPDIFKNVHKGIRRALFEACTALGRAEDGTDDDASARALLRGALHFVAHHGDNEDALLLPLLAARAPTLFQRLQRAHEHIDDALAGLRASLDSASTEQLYLHAARFIALYLQHMDDEEQALDPLIRHSIDAEELAGFGRRAVERTSQADQRSMLGWMLPSMTASDVETFLARVPAEARDELRRLAKRAHAAGEP